MTSEITNFYELLWEKRVKGTKGVKGDSGENAIALVGKDGKDVIPDNIPGDKGHTLVVTLYSQHGKDGLPGFLGKSGHDGLPGVQGEKGVDRPYTPSCLVLTNESRKSLGINASLMESDVVVEILTNGLYQLDIFSQSPVIFSIDRHLYGKFKEYNTTINLRKGMSLKFAINDYLSYRISLCMC